MYVFFFPLPFLLQRKRPLAMYPWVGRQKKTVFFKFYSKKNNFTDLILDYASAVFVYSIENLTKTIL